MPAKKGLDRSARSSERTRGVVDADKSPAAGGFISQEERQRRTDRLTGAEQVKAADPLCAPHLATGESVKAVTTVQGTAMCEAHAREWFGGVSTRG